MRRTRIKSLGFDTIKLEGSVFTSEIVQHAVFGETAKISKTAEVDYKIPRGLRLLDEIGRSFKIARSLWENLAESKLKEPGFIKEFFVDALSYPPQLFEKLININPLESTASWYIVCNSNYLRLVRKSSSLARPSYLEFGLGTILSENRFPDYQMLYRFMHGSRTLGLDDDGNGDCVWDVWKKAGEEMGVRVREGLRKGVSEALKVLGCGFLQFNAPGNDALRYALESGELSAQDYFQELMRLMYRFLFIITVEERKLIFEHLPESKEIHYKHTLYEKGYSLRRLRERSVRYNTGTHYGDLWEGIKIVFRVLGGEASSYNPLDLPTLGGLFSRDQCPHLDACGLSNAHLLEAMHLLRWTVEGNARTLVDYKNMGSEELGSVYESLLELVPQLDLHRRSFGFLESSSGNTRKTSGSYYTNTNLVECLIKSNLDPLIEEKLAASSKLTEEQKLLSITVIDPACGSGHFLLAASRRLAERLAFIRTKDAGVINEIMYRKSLRDVISSCIFGVDLNPMAVELARMALWLEGHEPGKPLSFLDHHIRCGNSLIGIMDLDVLSKGIPDDAYKVLSGDDKECAASYKKRNKNEREKTANSGLSLFGESIEKSTTELVKFHEELKRIENNNLENIRAKKALFENLHKSPEYRNIKTACDLYVSAFYADKKGKEAPFSTVPTSNDVHRASSGLEESEFSSGVHILAAGIAKDNYFFHWRLEFPDIFQKGGFDCVLANPPWERIKLQEEEFFASRSPEIANAPNKAARDRLIKNLNKSESGEYDKLLYGEFLQSRRNTEAASAYSHLKKDEGGRFPLTGIGDVNTYALFAETILDIKHRKGRAGFIVPTGIATDDSTKHYFAKISGSNLVSLYDFENREKLFPDVDSRFKFSLLSMGEGESTDLAFFLTNTDQLANSRRHFQLTRDEFMLLNPNTQTCPVFRSEKDAELTKKIYRNVPVLIREKDVSEAELRNPWGIRFMAMFHMANDSFLFHNEPVRDCLPLYEAKMMHQFDHRWATYTDSGKTEDVMSDQKGDVKFVVRPRYWVDKDEVLERVAGDDKKKPVPKWLMGWRRITNTTNERTLISAILPVYAAGDNMFLWFSSISDTKLLSCFFANQCTLTLDFCTRQKIGGTNLSFYYMEQLPFLPPKAYSQDDINFVVPRVLELTYTAVDLIPFAEDLWDAADPKIRMAFLEHRHGEKAGSFKEYTRFDSAHLAENAKAQGKKACLADILPPFVFDPERRALLRAALDARYARLYGLTRDDLRYILDPADLMGPDYPSETFRVIKEREEREFGEYKTQRLVLEAWDGV